MRNTTLKGEYCLRLCMHSLVPSPNHLHALCRYHSEQCAKSEKQFKADLAWLGKHRGEARQLAYLKDEILTRVVGFGWGEYKVRLSLPPPLPSVACACA